MNIQEGRLSRTDALDLGLLQIHVFLISALEGTIGPSNGEFNRSS